MIIGIKQIRQKGTTPKTEVFYCGDDGVEFRRIHQSLVEQNEEGAKYYRLTNPLLVPLQNVEHSTEDHPDELAARQNREAIADKTKGRIRQTELPRNEAQERVAAGKARQAELLALTSKELLDLAEDMNETANPKIPVANQMPKRAIANAILMSEGFTPPADTDENKEPRTKAELLETVEQLRSEGKTVDVDQNSTKAQIMEAIAAVSEQPQAWRPAAPSPLPPARRGINPPPARFAADSAMPQAKPVVSPSTPE
jgi:hypothetical protein